MRYDGFDGVGFVFFFYFFFSIGKFLWGINGRLADSIRNTKEIWVVCVMGWSPSIYWVWDWNWIEISLRRKSLLKPPEWTLCKNNVSPLDSVDFFFLLFISFFNCMEWKNRKFVEWWHSEVIGSALSSQVNF